MGGGLSTAPEETVVALAMTGDDRAFRELVLRRQAGLRDLLTRLCGSRAAADDLAQLAFVKAWKALPRLRAPEAFGPWLRAVAVNVWREEARRAGLDLTGEDAAAQVADPAAGPGQAEARLDLVRALGTLRPPERLCVVLMHAEGLTQAEVAELTGIPAGTVKSHVARGSAKLRRAMGLGARDE